MLLLKEVQAQIFLEKSQVEVPFFKKKNRMHSVILSLKNI